MAEKSKYIVRLTHLDRTTWKSGDAWGNPAIEELDSQWDESSKPQIGFHDKYVYQSMAYAIEGLPGKEFNALKRTPKCKSPRYFLRYYSRNEIETCTSENPFAEVTPESEWSCFGYQLL